MFLYFKYFSLLFFFFIFFFFNDTATTEIYTLSLHDALPISRPDQPVHRRRRAPAAPVRLDAADQRGFPRRPGLRVRHVVAAVPDHARVRVPRHRQEPERGPGGGHERGAFLGAGDADRRRAGRAGGFGGDPGHRIQPQLPDLRHLRLRRDHGRVAGPGPAARGGARGAAVRRVSRRRAADAGPDQHLRGNRAGTGGADRAVRRGAAADPGDLPATRGPGRGRRGPDREGAGMTITEHAPVVRAEAAPISP